MKRLHLLLAILLLAAGMKAGTYFASPEGTGDGLSVNTPAS